MKRIFALFSVFILFLTGCGQISADDVTSLIEGFLPEDNSTTVGAPPEGTVSTVHFIDVGQGDSEFIELPDGKTILIDASTRSAGEGVVSYIEDLGYNAIDVVIATHPHEDHIGGLPDVIDAFDIGQMYMSNGVTATKIFETLLDEISQKNIPTEVPTAGATLMSGTGYSLTCVGPMGSEYDNLNDYSLVARLDVGDSSFLFTGDCEAECEQEMIDAGMDLDVDVLKVGHHGSSTSSSEAFLDAVSPEVAVISCGADNEYGHPHSETLEKLDSLGCTVLRTDLNGDITVSTDGQNGYYLSFADAAA